MSATRAFPRPRPRRSSIAAAAVGLLILALAVAYTLTRAPEYRSSGTLALAAAGLPLEDKTALLRGFESAGGTGTFVELIDSQDTRAAAGRPVQITVRAIPDSRVIRTTATGSRADVKPALDAILAEARQRQRSLNDAWELRVIQRASAPERSGAGTLMLLLASVLFGLLGGAIALVAIRPDIGRVAAEPRRPAPRAVPT